MRQSLKKFAIAMALLASPALSSCAEPTGACVDYTYDSDFGTSETHCFDGVEASHCSGEFHDDKTCQDLGLHNCPLVAVLGGYCG